MIRPFLVLTMYVHCTYMHPNSRFQSSKINIIVQLEYGFALFQGQFLERKKNSLKNTLYV